MSEALIEHWRYNCTDCVRTRECGEVLAGVVKHMKLEEVEAFQQSLFHPVLYAMTRGVRVIKPQRDKLILEVQEAIDSGNQMFHHVLGHLLNINSPKQMINLFYNDLRQAPIMKRATKASPAHMTCDDEALTKIGSREPLLKPIVDAIADTRTLGKFMSMLSSELDEDGRMRCSYNIGGSSGGKSAPYSFRLSSSKNAFDKGMNLQNIPSDKSMSVGKAEKRGTKIHLPNIRSMFGPDPGFTFFDLDLDRADLQVVVWEANDLLLKTALRMGVDLHLLNAYSLAGKDPPPLDELVESHPKYPDHRGPFKRQREFAKRFCHATNYGGGSRTVSASLGESIHMVDKAQAVWFGAHPGIKEWHKRTEQFVLKHRFVENKFGYRWHIQDRLEGGLPEWLAWIPQSTVGCLINRIWVNVWNRARWIEVLLQVHDSIAGQIPSHRLDEGQHILHECSQITIPYDDPLTIPIGIKTSPQSWGDCE